MKRHLEFFRSMRHAYFASCWHRSDHESTAMWRLYLGEAPGVAVRTNCRSLKNSLARVTEAVYVGHVIYVDFHKDAVTWQNMLAPAFFKRQEFEYEQEVRAVIYDVGNAVVPGYQRGKFVTLLLSTLIDSIVLSPACEPALAAEIESRTRAHGVHAPIHRSSLDEGPAY